MKAPAFWYVDEGREAAPILRALLTPLSWLYAAATARRIARATPCDPGAPVISVGNLTAGGAGKTPVALALAAAATALGRSPHIVSRGYGGRLAGPVRVDAAAHAAAAVGDEPLMMAAEAPVWVARDRAAGARAAVAAGADLVILDDAHQNPAVRKTLSLVVVDAQAGFGNGRVIPAGPLREPPAAGLARADVLVLMGDGAFAPPDGLPVVRARLLAVAPPPPGRYLAFCGVGRPEKFNDLLRALGVDLIDLLPFPDHHPYTDREIAHLRARAAAEGARLLTTRKDAVRLAPAVRAETVVLDVTAVADGGWAALIARALEG